MELPEPAEVQIVRDNYEKAFECLNAGLLADEVGNKVRALPLYRQGRRHLLQGLEVPTQGKTCVGANWDAARQMQHKMNKTLSTITTRLAVLETTPPPTAEGGPDQRLYPTLPVIQGTQSMATPKVRCTDNTLPATSAGGVPPPPASPLMAFDVPSELPPAYTPQATDGHLSLSHGMKKSPWSSPALGFAPPPPSVNEEVLLFLPQGVQIFFVATDGQVSAPSHPGYLRIFLTNRNPDNTTRQPPAYLQVCDWLYPLFPDSPVLLSNAGVFTFPDTTATAPGSYVGVVLSPQLPESDRSLFQDQLSLLTDLRVQPKDEEWVEGGAAVEKVPGHTPMETDPYPVAVPGEEEEDKHLPEWSEKFSQSILTGATWLGQGLVKGADATGRAIQKGATRLRDHITPEETPAEVSPKVTRGLQVAKQATGGAVKVSQFLVDGVSTVVSRVGRELAPHVKKHGGKLIPESLKKNKDGNSNLDGAKVVAASSIQGLSTVWTSLEVAAKCVGKSLGLETVNTVRHKYGDEAGQAADTAVQSVTNVGITALNVDNLRFKAVLKATGKETAKAMVGKKTAEKPKENGQEKMEEPNTQMSRDIVPHKNAP